MSALADTARALVQGVEQMAPGELHATCREEAFHDVACQLAAHARLADLFAGTEGEASTLTAIFAAREEPGWVLLRTVLSKGCFDSLTPALHAASWYEREIKEMYGLEPLGHPAPAPLRLAAWPPGVAPMRDEIPEHLPPVPVQARPGIVRGQGVLQVPLGPVRSGPQESGEFLFSSGGEDLVAVSLGLGYKFRAVERLAEGRSPDVALALAERLAGISTFANALAFAQACERARRIEVPAAARHARAVLGEMERLHHHFGTLARVAEACGQTVASALLNVLKEEVIRACAHLTGHRYLRGVLTIGGVSYPLPARGLAELSEQAKAWADRAAGTADLLRDTATFVDRLVGTAILTPDYAALHYLVGPIGRASGLDVDARRDRPYAAFENLPFEVPMDNRGDAAARVAVLQKEILESASLLGRLGEAPIHGQLSEESPDLGGVGLGWAEAPGGETLHYVELDQRGTVRRWRARPPAVVNWHSFAHACASGNNLTDFPVLEASFGLSHAEFDR